MTCAWFARSAYAATTSSTIGCALRAAEGDDLAARLELAEEEHVVDQLARLLDLLAGLLHQLGDVRARQGRGLEQNEQPRKRRPQLVRDTAAVKPGAELLVRGELRRRFEEEDEQVGMLLRKLLAEALAGFEAADRAREPRRSRRLRAARCRGRRAVRRTSR